MLWDPGEYRRFGAERSRPFYELLGRIGATAPGFVADVGCGPGELTGELCRRWPGARVLGVDSSPEMIEAADAVRAGLNGEAGDRLRFEVADAADWQPPTPPDVIVSNAMLQWLPDHEQVVLRWARLLPAGGWLAFQIPGNNRAATHALIRELAATPRWRTSLGELGLNRQADDPATYLDLLGREGLAVDAWETTYLHVLAGDDPVLRWYRGTGLRPVIAALSADEQEEFLAEYAILLRKQFPRQPYGTVLPFRRVFVVAHRSG